jgi:general stress protein CsbA
MNSLVYIDLPIALVPIYFLRNIFTIRFPTCTIIIHAYFSLGVLCYVTAVLTVVLIKTEHKTGVQGATDCIVLLDSASSTVFCVRDNKHK